MFKFTDDKKVLPAGVHAFTVMEVVQRESSTGKPMLEMRLAFADNVIVRDYILSAQGWKVKAMLRSLGLDALADEPEFDPEILKGREGVCELTVETHEKYGPQNRLTAYLNKSEVPV